MCKISLNIYSNKSSHEPKLKILHSKQSESTKPAFTPKYEYVEVAQLIINPDNFDNSCPKIIPTETSVSVSNDESNRKPQQYRSNIQNAIEFSQFGTKQHTSRIIITEPMLENIMKIR